MIENPPAPVYRSDTDPRGGRRCGNWIPVDEIRFLFRHLERLGLKDVGGKIDLRDLLGLQPYRKW